MTTTPLTLLLISLPALSPSPEVDGSPVCNVKQQEHDREHAQEHQVSLGEPIRFVGAQKDNLDTGLMVKLSKNADFMLHQDCLKSAFCIYHFRYIPCVALFLRVTGFPFLGTRSLHSAASSDLAMKAPLLCCLLPLRTFFNLSFSKITVYSRSAPKTKIIQAITQHSMAVNPSALKT